MEIFKKIKKYKIYLLIFIVCLLIMIISMLRETNIFDIVKSFIFNREYRENFTLAEGDIKYNISLIQVIKQVFSNYRWKFDYIIIFGTNFFQILLPCIVSISGLVFYKKYNSILKLSIYKVKNFRKYITREIFKEAIKVSASVFASFLVFYLIVLVISKGDMHSSMERTLFIDILGKNFYTSHTYIYYILDGLTRFLIIPFIYSFMSCSLALILKNEKQVFFSSNIYYYGFCMIGFALYYIIGSWAIYINPSVIMASGTYSDVNTLLLFVIHCVPIIISLVIIKRHTKYVEI